MGTYILIFVMVLLCYYCSPASSLPLGKTLPPVQFQGKGVNTTGINEHGNSASRGRGSIYHLTNIAHGNGGTNGHGDQGSSRVPGGAAVNPLYAAAAAGRHKNHHSGGSCNRSCTGLPTLCAVILASYLGHIHVVFRLGPY